jgi:hypothetical protein
MSSPQYYNSDEQTDSKSSSGSDSGGEYSLSERFSKRKKKITNTITGKISISQRKLKKRVQPTDSSKANEVVKGFSPRKY